MAYIPDPNDATQPQLGVSAATAAAEFRALKNKVNAMGGTPQFPLTLKNSLINGDFRRALRATSAVLSSSTGYYTIDRWLNTINNYLGGTLTISQQPLGAGVIALAREETRNFMLLASAALTTGVNGQVAFWQKIESVRRHAGKRVTVSFLAAASANMDLAVTFAQDFGSGGSPSPLTYLPGQIVSVTTSWQRFSLQYDIPSIYLKTLGSANNDNLVFALSPVIKGAVAAASGIAELTDANFTGKSLYLAEVQLEENSVATPFESLPDNLNNLLCDRYYTRVRAHARFMATAGAQTFESPIYWPTTMRGAPTCAIISTPVTANLAGGSPQVYSPAADSARFYIASNAAGDTYAVECVIAADAEL